MSSDSPLRYLPTTISREQGLFFDGIRFTSRTAILSYDRLLETLEEIAKQKRGGRAEADEQLVVCALADAWTIVDVVQRLRMILHQMPGWKKKALGARLFDERTGDVEDLRHFVQHINNEVKGLIASGVPLLGFLQWVAILDAKGTARAYMLVSGTVGTFEQDVVIMKKEPLGGAVGQVRLVAGNKVLWLEPLIREVRQLAREVEQGLSDYGQGRPRRVADLVVEITLDDLRLRP